MCDMDNLANVEVVVVDADCSDLCYTVVEDGEAQEPKEEA